MKAYIEYKDSGVQWIGKVPSHWEILAFKYCMKINNGQDYKHILVDEGYPVFGSGGPFAFASQFIYDGEVVMLGRKGTIDKPLYYKGKFWTVDTMFYAIPTKRSVCRFMYYLARTFPFNYYSTATALPSMTQFDLGNNPIALPPLPEQQAIASFLDAKTKPIDDIIAKREKQIELLEEMKSAIISRAVTKGLNPEAQMKDSGIEWIGKVPEHWEVADLKRYAKISTGKTPSTKKDEYFENEEIVWFTPGDFPDCSIILNDSSRKIDKRAIKASEAFLYPKNSVFLVGIGGTLGKIGIFEEEASCNQQINVIVCNSDIIKNYVAYYLYSKKEILKVYSNAATLPILNQDKTGYIKIALPPLSEQQAIASYLDSETSKIDSRIAKRRKQIELLQEYKQALITAAVTGKIDVREHIS